MTTIILDWDDTLLPTTLIQNSFIIDRSIFQNLESILICFVSLLMTKGDVHIVTNANLEWVYQTCPLYYPNFFVLLKQIPIISTFSIRDKCESKDPTVWKACAMREILKNSRLIEPHQIISFGDSHFERIAVFTIGNIMKCRAKHFHFISNPTIRDLESQWLKIHKILEDVFNDSRTIDCCLKQSENKIFDIVIKEIVINPIILPLDSYDSNSESEKDEKENEIIISA